MKSKLKIRAKSVYSTKNANQKIKLITGRAYIGIECISTSEKRIGLFYVFPGTEVILDKKLKLYFSEDSEIEIENLSEDFYSIPNDIYMLLINKIVLLTGYSVYDSVLTSLDELQKYYGNCFYVTRKELAAMSGCSREMVGRTLKKLIKSNYLEHTTGKKIKIKS